MRKLAICGPGSCGKDTVANWLDTNTPLRRGPSTSEFILPVVAERLGISLVQAWLEREKNRDLWAAIGDELRGDDPAALAKQAMERGDICVGLRRREELVAAQAAGLFDLTIWVSRRNLPPDTSLTYGAELCDIIVPNWLGLEALYSRLARLVGMWNFQ